MAPISDLDAYFVDFLSSIGGSSKTRPAQSFPVLSLVLLVVVFVFFYCIGYMIGLYLEIPGVEHQLLDDIELLTLAPANPTTTSDQCLSLLYPIYVLCCANNQTVQDIPI
jgi:hypothetical protein